MDDLEAFALLAPEADKVAVRDWRGVKFTEYVREVGLQLSPGQLALALVAYDGLEPRDLPPELRHLGYRIFGPVEVLPTAARRVLVLVGGARGGKSYVLSAHRTIHLALSVDLSTLAPGEHAFGAIVAPNPQQRDQCYSFVLGAVLHPVLAALLDGKPGTESLTLLRADGHRVTIEAIPSKRGGGAIRSRWHTSVALEECAFFQDENHAVNDQDIFDAAFPRILRGGQILLPSTPWAEAGLLYEEFVANHPDPSCAAKHLRQKGVPRTAIAAHAPTLVLWDSDLNRETIELARARDSAKAQREYDAQFIPLGASNYFDAAEIAEAVDEELVNGAARSPYSVAVVGADLGFVRDAATGAACERTAASYALLSYTEQLPTVQRLKPSEVFAGLAELADTYDSDTIVADGHYAESAREAFLDRPRQVALIEIPGGNTGKAEVFALARNLLGERSLRLPNDSRLLQQLREVKKRPVPGGGYVIEQPRKPSGGHGDIVSALVAGLWWLQKLELPAMPREAPADPIQADAEAWHQRIDGDIAERARRARIEAETGFSFDE